MNHKKKDQNIEGIKIHYHYWQHDCPGEVLQHPDFKKCDKVNTKSFGQKRDKIHKETILGKENLHYHDNQHFHCPRWYW